MLIGLALSVREARAASITVDKSADTDPNGSCTLADAITAANTDTAANGCPGGNGADTITLAVNITLAADLPRITSEIAIEGADYDIDGNGQRIIFWIEGGDLTVNNITLTGGRAVNYGGAINAEDGSTLTVRNSRLEDNRAGLLGGAISASNTDVVISNSVFVDNYSGSLGGAVSFFSLTPTSRGWTDEMAVATLLIDETAFGEDTPSSCSAADISADPENEAAAAGGAIDIAGGMVTIRRSSFIGNKAGTDGGAIFASAYRMLFENNTVSCNRADASGGGMYIVMGDLILRHSTIYQNSAGNEGGGTYYVDDSPAPGEDDGPEEGIGLYLQNSIVAGSTGGGDCESNVTEIAHNIGMYVGDGTCDPACSAQDGPINLGELQGEPAYHPLLDGSIAINRADMEVCSLPQMAEDAGSQTARSQQAMDFTDMNICEQLEPGQDQIGTNRPMYGNCDIGAIESRTGAVLPDEDLTNQDDRLEDTDTPEPDPPDTDTPDPGQNNPPQPPEPEDTDTPVPPDTDTPVPGQNNPPQPPEPEDTDTPVPPDTDTPDPGQNNPPQPPEPEDTDTPVPPDTDTPDPGQNDPPQPPEPEDTDTPVPPDTDTPDPGQNNPPQTPEPEDTDTPVPPDTDTPEPEPPEPPNEPATDTPEPGADNPPDPQDPPDPVGTDTPEPGNGNPPNPLDPEDANTPTSSPTATQDPGLFIPPVEATERAEATETKAAEQTQTALPPTQTSEVATSVAQLTETQAAGATQTEVALLPPLEQTAFALTETATQSVDPLATRSATPDPATSCRHTVAVGDTLFQLAQTYNTTVADFRAINQLTEDALFVDSELIVPDCYRPGDDIESSSLDFSCQNLYDSMVVRSASRVVGCREVDIGLIDKHPALASGMIAAIDIFGYVESGVEVCFRNIGELVLLDRVTAPPTPRPLPSYNNVAGMTCGEVNRPGTLVLVAAVIERDTFVELTSCRVTTTQTVRLREDVGSARVLRLVPYNVTLDSYSRTSNWFNVAFLGTEGWISARYTRASGICE